MLYRNVAVPYDNSASAHAALLEALKIARSDSETTIHLIHIVDTEQRVIDKLKAQSGKPDAPKPSPEALHSLFDQVINDASVELHARIDDTLAGSRNTIKIDLIEETVPGDQIAMYAKENQCDLIIMGSRGLGALRGIIGSVSNHVLRTSPIPVMIVKQQ